MTLVLRDIADGVGAITLNRPEQMNALTVALGVELEQAILELGDDPGVNVVVIRGAGGNFARAAISTKSSHCARVVPRRCADCLRRFAAPATPSHVCRSR